MLCVEFLHVKIFRTERDMRFRSLSDFSPLRVLKKEEQRISIGIR